MGVLGEEGKGVKKKREEVRGEESSFCEQKEAKKLCPWRGCQVAAGGWWGSCGRVGLIPVLGCGGGDFFATPAVLSRG